MGFDVVSEVVVFITVQDEKEGIALGRILIQNKVAACVNLIPKIHSIFEWKGEIVEEAECLVVVKSTAEAFNSLEAMVKLHHSYRIPEIIALPIIAGSTDYLSWIHDVMKPL